MIPFLENKNVWEIPYLKIANIHFMVFDRYEIHIQAFVPFINAMAIISKSSSSEDMIQKEVLKKTHKKNEKRNICV